MAMFSVYKIYMLMHDYGLVERPHAAALTSVSLIGRTVNLAAIGLDSSAIGDCPAAGTGVSLYCHCSWG